MAREMKKDYHNQIIKYGLIATAILIPLIRYPYLVDTIDLPKFTSLLLISTILAVIWLAHPIIKGKLSLKTSSLYLPVLGFLIISVLATLTSIRPITSFWGDIRRYQGLLSLICYLVLFFLTANYFRNTQDRWHFVLAAAFTGSVVAIIGILQHFGFSFGNLNPYFFGRITRIESSFGNPNFLGAFLNLTIPLTSAAIFLLIGDSGRSRITNQGLRPVLIAVIAISSILQLVALYYTLTRGSWVGLISAFLATCLLILLATPAVKRKVFVPTLIVLLILTLLLSVVGLTVFYYRNPLSAKKSRFNPTLVLESVTGTKGSRARIILWSVTLKMVRDHPILGIGPDTFAMAFPPYRPPAYDKVFGIKAFPDRPHNDLLQVAAETGIPGLLFYLWIYAAAIRNIVKILRENSSTADVILSLFLFASITGYFVQNQFNFHTIGTAPMFWMTIGLISSINAGKEKTITLSLAGWNYLSSSVRVIVLASLSCILVVTALRFGYLPLAASWYAYRAVGLQKTGSFAQAITEAEKGRDLMPAYEDYSILVGKIYDLASLSNQQTSNYYHNLAIKNLEEAVEINPLARRAYLELGVSHLKFGERSRNPDSIIKGIQVFEEAIELEPNFSESHYNLGVAYLYLGELEKATEELRRTISLYPTEKDAFFLLGKIFEERGENKEAIEFFKKVLEIDPNYSRKKEVTEALNRLSR